MTRALTPLCLALLLAVTLLAGCVVEERPGFYRPGYYGAPHFHDRDDYWHRWR